MVDELGARLRSLRLIVLDFDGVLTDNRVIVMQDGSEGVVCNRSDGLGIQALRELGIDWLVLSKESNPVVQQRCGKLNLACVSSCDDKPTALRKEVGQRGLDLAEVAYMGNDINDIECLDIVGLPVCVKDAWPEVHKHARIATTRCGGQGAVREFCEMVIEAHQEPVAV